MATGVNGAADRAVGAFGGGECLAVHRVAEAMASRSARAAGAERGGADAGTWSCMIIARERRAQHSAQHTGDWFVSRMVVCRSNRARAVLDYRCGGDE